MSTAATAATTTNPNTVVEEKTPEIVSSAASSITQINTPTQEIEKPKWGQADAYDDADGGYGWFVVVGCLLAQFTSFGPALSWYVELMLDMTTMY
ncbi:hypothetical protein O0I10_001043 [Lichtheimia ornata]|uniref:Uncharacterized protein n=1 Tax=Lichtheimia ornata TaxID=688661 RepID=A0AAD8DIC0_9FUNG|nr:uncharacterized protein O0I10_001043 [Lichtheimia ornata]KAJ8662867.1 hypothetical protein O0I10_001043 [Lichtheimia ornata]